MKRVTIYTRQGCSYSTAAKSILKGRGIAFEEIDLAAEPERRAEMVGRAAGAMTIPQIFVGDTHVGGLDRLYELDEAGKLMPLVNG
jgi:glutaredoxin 3